MRKTLKLAIVLTCLCCALCQPLQSQNSAKVLTGDVRPNALAQQGKPYVILVSLDGFRYDYAGKYGAPNLVSLAARGASAPEGMIPSYPSVTFPNHYTLVTGLYPEHHGIVANSFYDPALKQSYASNQSRSTADGQWYGGVPLWVLAEKQGMRSACFFWPSSDAEIDGTRPTYYLNYDGRIPDDERIEQVISWLKLPPEQRPHFITLYYSEPDHAGHEFGPESQQTADAVHHVDALIGTLVADLKGLPLRVDLIVVSDHGMATVQGDWIDLDHYADLSQFQTDGSLLYPNDEAAAARAYRQLRGASDKFVVYRRSGVPARLHYDSNARIGDPVVIPTGPYMIRAHAPHTPEDPKPDVKGMHGYDPNKMKSMRAIFYAAGPDIRPGVTLPPFENTEIYPFVARILGLPIGAVDGHGEALHGILQP
jgi:predicted AlkP superfamily pyrophosphatase or phosphodiesterase